MVYTQARLDEVLLVFREAKLRSSCQDLSRKRLRPKYELRRTVISTQQKVVGFCDESADSDDEYDPDKPRKKRTSGTIMQKNKKRRAEATEEGSNKRRQGGQVGLDCTTEPSIYYDERDKDIRQLCKTSFITIFLTAEMSRRQLSEFARIHGTGFEKQVQVEETVGQSTFRQRMAPWERERHSKFVSASYFNKLDVESDQIDNSSGRALRNRTVPDLSLKSKKNEDKPPCVACREMDKNCVYGKKSKNETCISCARDNKKCYTSTEKSKHAETYPLQIAKKDNNIVPDALSNPGLHTPYQKPLLAMSSSTPRMDVLGSDVIMLSPSPSPEPDDSALLTGRITTIDTCFAHPINFKAGDSVQEPCSFCHNFKFGIVGHDLLRNVQVMQFPGSPDYEETGNGHRSKGHEPTKMCVVCSLTRIQISRCKYHDLEIIPGINIQNWNSLAYFDQFKKTCSLSDKSVKPACSVCVLPALFRCVVKQRESKISKAFAQSDRRPAVGCGLLLCPVCAGIVRKCKDVLRWGEMEIDPANGKTRRLRADLEFLFPGSLLHKVYGTI